MLPMGTPLPADRLIKLRARWQQLRSQQPPEALRILLLASYTIDPLAPYLGVGLWDAGVPASVSVGAANQLAQQLLDENGILVRERPEVVVVAPRFEELGARADGPGHAPAAWREELVRLADLAVAAAERREFCLGFVLPAVPESRPYGIGDAGTVGGVVATAGLAREAVRARLAGRPGVYIVDAEEAVRAVGSRQAHHPALFRFAKVPYVEDVFASLAEQLSRVLRARHGHGREVVVLDSDSLLSAAPSAREAIDALRAPLLELQHAGVALAVRCSAEDDAAWDALAEAPELLGELVENSVIDARPVAEQLRSIATDAAVPVEQTLLLTADEALAADLGGRAVVLAGEPDAWPATLRAAGAFDRAPDVVLPGERVAPALAGAGPRDDGAELSLADFVAGLEVSISYAPLREQDVPKVAELVERAKNFTLGIPHSAADIGDRAADVIAVSVRDRLGDHGISAAIELRNTGGACIVDLFSLSCAVLGRDVQDAVLGEIVDRAARDGCDTVILRYRSTGRNQLAVGFVEAAATRAWRSSSGVEVRVRADRAEDSA